MYTPSGFKKRHYIPFFGLLMCGVLSIALGVNLSLKEAHSATGSMYMQAPATAITGKTVDIAVRINPGGARIDTVTATVGFDQSKFAYSKVSFAGSPFTTQLPTKTTKDSVTVTSSLLGGGTVGDDSLIALVSFTPRNYETSFQSDFSLSGNAAIAGTATDPAYTNTTFAFTQASKSPVATNPIKNLATTPPAQPGGSTGTPGAAAPGSSPLNDITPEDGTAVYNGAQILLKSSDVIAQARQVTPRSYVMIAAGFFLLSATLVLFVYFKKRHDEHLQLESHFNQLRSFGSA